MTHSSELFTANAISILRTLEFEHPVESGVPVAPDICFHWDNKQASVDITVKSRPGHLVDMWAKVSGTPRWLSFTLSLGECSFRSGDTLGLIVELEGCGGETLPVIIRSSRDGTPADTPVLDTLTGSDDRVVRTLLHTIAPQDALTGGTAFHMLIIQLPRRDFRLDLRDLRLVVIPAERRFNSPPGTGPKAG